MPAHINGSGECARGTLMLGQGGARSHSSQSGGMTSSTRVRDCRADGGRALLASCLLCRRYVGEHQLCPTTSEPGEMSPLETKLPSPSRGGVGSSFDCSYFPSILSFSPPFACSAWHRFIDALLRTYVVLIFN